MIYYLNKKCNNNSRRGGRVVEGARLESVYRGNSIMGSNPILSAIIFNSKSAFIQKKKNIENFSKKEVISVDIIE